MEYSIGEVSNILNLSKDMVRYYEKQGAIKASRNPENNYRTYETMEVFWLLEAVQHKSWGIPISEIAEFDSKVFEALPAYARSKGYSIRENEPMRGILLGRGYDDGRFHRIVRLNLPIQI